MAQLLIADIETTGLGKGYDEILEFSFLVMDEKVEKVLDQGTLFFYHPEQRRSHPEAFKVHNYTKEFLKEKTEELGQDFHDNMAKMYKLFTKSNFVGFNSERFDVPFITAYLRMHGYGEVYPSRNIDMMKVFLPTHGRASLRKMMTYMKVKDDTIVSLLRHYFKGYYFRENAHNAAFDVIETMFLLAEAHKRGMY